MVDLEREKQLVRKLVERLHLSVPERLELPNRTARLELIVATIGEIVRDRGQFPADADLDGPCDAGVIVREPPFFRVNWRHEVGLGRYETVRRRRYLRLSSAVRSLVRDGWKFQIDGVPIR